MKHYCGLFAVIGHPKAVELTRFGLHAIQHRGEESSAISYLADGEIQRIGGMGLVHEAITPNLPTADAAIGHVRYSTTGDSSACNIQPLYNANRSTVLAHNGNLTNTKFLRENIDTSATDSEVILDLLGEFDSDATQLGKTLLKLEGAYCLLLMTKSHIFATRDPMGFRPLSLGRLGNSTIISSESCAIEAIGGICLRDIRPGEIFRIDHQTQQVEISRFGVGSKRAQCIFELIYFSDPASTIFGHNVHLIRHKMGEVLAEEQPVDADMVVPVPHSGIDAAMGYSKVSGLHYGRAFTTNNYAGRSFIMPEQTSREQKVAAKLHVVTDVVRGKRLCVVEDSVVRGTNGKIMVQMLRKAGAREIHLRIASPPIQHGCFYGIDFPDKKKLISYQRSIEEIGQALSVDSIGYLSIEGMLRCVDEPADFCTACFTGKYPTQALN